jgi:hypothetical protein
MLLPASFAIDLCTPRGPFGYAQGKEELIAASLYGTDKSVP